MRISTIVLILALVSFCFSQEQWSGTWSGTSAYGPVQGTWTGTVENGQIHGTVTAPSLGLSGSLTGTWSQGQVSAGAVLGEGQQVRWSGTVSGNSASGTWSLSEYSAQGTWNGQTADTQPPRQPVCGNNVAEGSEECDGTDLKGKTCIILGYDSGILLCTPDCTLDTIRCNNGDAPPQNQTPIVDPIRPPPTCCAPAVAILGLLSAVVLTGRTN